MPAATVLLTLLLSLGHASSPAGQAATPKSSAPEVFNATAEVKNARGGLTGTLEARVTRYTPEFDRNTVESALRHGGYPAFLTALRNAPEVGQVIVAAHAPDEARARAVSSGVMPVDLGSDIDRIGLDRDADHPPVTGGNKATSRPSAASGAAMTPSIAPRMRAGSAKASAPRTSRAASQLTRSAIVATPAGGSTTSSETPIRSRTQAK